MKTRLDKLLVERSLVPSRERAQALILAGKVLVNEQKVSKSGAAVDSDARIRLLEPDLKYVSRGGLKLEKALKHWRIQVEDRTCVDVGASTGGFTDCLLQHGARLVIAIDTGYGQLDYRLRQNPRVKLLEKTNARHLTTEDLRSLLSDPEAEVSEGSSRFMTSTQPTASTGTTGSDQAASSNQSSSFHEASQAAPLLFADLIVMDVSFISATLVLPAVIAAAFPADATARSGRELVVLVKPQFEAGREHVGKGGIVHDERAQLAAVERVKAAVSSLGAARIDFIDSPILGAEGNREFLLYAKF